MSKPLSPETMALVKATAPALQQHGVEITTRMYQRLFVDPEIKALFDMAAHESGAPLDLTPNGATPGEALPTGSHRLAAGTQAVVDLINGSDATVIAVSAGRGESAQPVIDAHRALIAAAPTGRLIVVGGAGSLLTSDGTRLVDTPGFPEEYKPEAQAFTEILDLYREAGSTLTWTFLSPAPEFTDKPRTGSYVEGTDQPAGSEISVADFAVALVDEAEKDAHRGHRWTIANA